MAVSLEDYHIWQFPEFTSEQTDAPGQYLCTDRGIFKITEETVDTDGYTFGKIELFLRPTGDEDYDSVGMSPISLTVFDAM
jgi:hypothetical protein